jgi:hypothetical protein
MNEATIRTWNMLPSLGFQPDSGVVFSDIRPRLSLDFGNLKLLAAAVVSPYSGEIVLFSGVLATRDTVAEVHFELPRRIESLKQCAAWIVWNLDQHSNGRTFRPARDVDWINEARQNRRLLPWVTSQAEFEARPHCTIQRDWLRLALRTMGKHLASLPDDSLTSFSFDGSIFSIRCNTTVIAFPGEGSPWTVRFTVEARKLRRSPKRLMSEYIEVSVWQSRIQIGSRSYEGTAGLLSGEYFSAVQ